MRLARQTPWTRRQVLAACAGDPAGPMTAAQKAQLLHQLLIRTWAPTPHDTPVAFAAVEAWVADHERRDVTRRMPQ